MAWQFPGPACPPARRLPRGINDPDLIKAQQAWSACMARNGYDTVQGEHDMAPVRDQLPSRVRSDRRVTANQQALNAAVREFKANYAREIRKLPALLRTTSATPNLPGPKPGKSAR